MTNSLQMKLVYKMISDAQFIRDKVVAKMRLLQDCVSVYVVQERLRNFAQPFQITPTQFS